MTPGLGNTLWETKLHSDVRKQEHILIIARHDPQPWSCSNPHPHFSQICCQVLIQGPLKRNYSLYCCRSGCKWLQLFAPLFFFSATCTVFSSEEDSSAVLAWWPELRTNTLPVRLWYHLCSENLPNWLTQRASQLKKNRKMKIYNFLFVCLYYGKPSYTKGTQVEWGWRQNTKLSKDQNIDKVKVLCACISHGGLKWKKKVSLANL